MSKSDKHDPKDGNSGGSRVHSTVEGDVREPDRTTKADPGAKNSAGKQPAADDPHKVEKLARAGRKDVDPDAGSD